MRLLYGVQRYGEGVAGGAETACRDFAEQMAARGHGVEVLTSCAVDYVTWADEFEPGISELNGVTVHRLRVREERAPRRFHPLSSRVFGERTPLAAQRDWTRIQGPDLPELEPWLDQHAGRFDVAAFYTYLYPVTAFGLPVAARSTATVLHPAAHDEPMLELPIFDDLFAAAGGLALHTPEELATIRRRFRFDRPAEVVGLGIDTDRSRGVADRFRAAYDIGDDPVLLFVGRVEPAKGTDELARYFAEYRRRHDGPLKLVMVGALVDEPRDHPDIICTGFVSEQSRRDAIAAATVFVMPSYFESFSISLCEAWLEEKPALVQGECAVLAGQVGRASGGIAYVRYAEFDACLERLLQDASLCRSLGRSGADYVRSNFRWGEVLGRYEQLIDAVVNQRRARLRALNRPGSLGAR
jgi:glycosyltransferase involved in cell wall biosynthesis